VLVALSTSTSETSAPASAPNRRLPVKKLTGNVTPGFAPTTNPIAGKPPAAPSGSIGCGPSIPGTRTGGPSLAGTLATVSSPLPPTSAKRNGDRSITSCVPFPASTVSGASCAAAAGATEPSSRAVRSSARRTRPMFPQRPGTMRRGEYRLSIPFLC
jgi:hypothetical protein